MLLWTDVKNDYSKGNTFTATHVQDDQLTNQNKDARQKFVIQDILNSATTRIPLPTD